VSPREVARFAKLFEGYSKAHGVYVLGKAAENGKIGGKPSTAPGAPTLQMFERHLKGTGPGIGVVMLRDDDTCVFGAIDYDVRTMDHVKAEQAVKRLQLPLVLCRSKSGGGHFYAFMAEPVPAGLLRDRLDEWKALLGMSNKTETFPKQSARFSDNDIGNWINLPYFAAPATERYAVIEGQPASLAAFLDAAEASKVSMEAMEHATFTDGSGLFSEGPPCLQVLHGQGGFAEGTRNEGMMAVVVYLRKRYGDAWEKHIDEYNQVMAQLPSSEVVQLVKSNSRKEYAYACKKAPINSVCQRRVCTQREFGVGDGPNDSRGYTINSLTRYDSAHGDEPMWGMEVNGKRVMVSNSQFYNRDDFNRAVMAQANVVPIHMTPAKWLRYLSEIIVAADVMSMPDDAGPTGQLWQSIQNFTLQTANAIEKEEVWLGKPYRENGKIYFRSNDLFRYLDARKVKYPSTQAVWQLLRNHDADKDQWHHKGRFINVWSLPIAADWDEKDEDLPKTNFAPSDDF
jgi:hypothetical protein